MQGGGTMTKYAEYDYLKQPKKEVEILKTKPLDPLEYPFMVQNPVKEVVIEQPIQDKTPQEQTPNPTPISVQQSPETKSKLDKVLDYALSRAHKNSTHYCARYVRQALESQGFKPGHSINGWEYEKAAKNMGWKEVTDGSIKKGDLIVTKKHDGGGHVALATKDNADIFNDRTSSVSDFVSRGVPYNKSKVKSVKIFRSAKEGMKFETPFTAYDFIKPSTKARVPYLPKTSDPYNILNNPYLLSYHNQIAATPYNFLKVPEPQEKQALGPTKDFNQDLSTYDGPITKQYLAHLYSTVLSEKGIDQKYVKNLVAQDILESGANFSHRAGKFNLGGIKGKGNIVTTKDYINGQYVTQKQSFKNYNHPIEYVRDKVDLLARKGVFNGGDYIDNVIKAKYSTDPAYRSSYNAVLKSLTI